MNPTVFHLAFAVFDLQATREFYVERLGCREGRSAARWIDFDLYGHQISAHLVDRSGAGERPTNAVDGDAVPIPHFGVVLPPEEWKALAARLTAAGQRFRIGPRVRFAGEVGEQSTMFLDDPSGNVLEFKSFASPDRLFAS